MHIQSHASDNLKTIKGIAEARENWLHQIGIYTIEDLSTSKAARIRDELKIAGHSTPLDAIEGWISKAKTFVSSNTTTSQPTGTVSSVRVEESDSSLIKWETFAEFFVDYQHQPTDDGGWKERTKVHRMRNGGKDKFWEGLVGEAVGRWMLEQLDEAESLPLTVKTRPSVVPSQHKPPKPSSQIAVSIQDVELVQVSNNDNPVKLDKTGQIFTHPLRSGTPFDLHIIFELTGTVDNNNSSDTCISAQAYTTNKSTGETLLLDESQPQTLLPGQTRQMVKLSEIRLSQGIYRLQLMIQVVELPGILGFLEVPFLWVT